MIKATCPICGNQVEGESLARLAYFPFCSKQCKLIDLGRWLDGTYRLDPDEPDDAPEVEDAP